MSKFFCFLQPSVESNGLLDKSLGKEFTVPITLSVSVSKSLCPVCETNQFDFKVKARMSVVVQMKLELTFSIL